MKRLWLGRFGWVPAVLIPLWGLWAFSWFTLKGIEGWVERAPWHYGIHLYKQQAKGQLELFARVIDLFETGEVQSPLEYLNMEYQRGEIDRMAVLFGLNAPVMIVEGEGFDILYPSRPTGAMTGLLEAPEPRDALMNSLRRMVERGEKEGMLSLPDEGGPGPGGVGKHWYLSVARSSGDLLCVLLLPEDSFLLAGDVLQAAHQARFEEQLRRFLFITLPVLALCSLWILLLPTRRLPPGRLRDGEDEA